MNKPVAPFRKTIFAVPGALPSSLSAVSSLLSAVGDVSFILSPDGIILDVAVSQGDLANQGFSNWIGSPWIDTVTIESRPKIGELIVAATDATSAPRWRQVNHSVPGGELPVRYLVMSIGGGERLIAVGREMQSTAAIQQRLIQTQQSLERDYIRLRQAETRYRLMFESTSEPMLIVDAQTRRIREVNRATCQLLEAAEGDLVGSAVGDIVDPDDRDMFIGHLGAAEAADDLSPVTVKLRGNKREAAVSARLFRQARTSLLIVRVTLAEHVVAGHEHDAALGDVVERMPDSFVLLDRDLNILVANAAFVELAQMPSAERVHGEPVSNWLGRPGIDLELMVNQLREHGAVRNVATILRGSAGTEEEVEVSGVIAPMGNGSCYGFTIRNVARRLRDTPVVTRDIPRSVEQLTELVGRISLKEIVRESTDLVERLCIEAALAYTSDNRASAAEILGVSRQSLYSRLHRHGIGNLVSSDS